MTGTLLADIEAPENNAMNETMAINAIQKTLMLCETVVNSTSSSITMSGTPPAYSTAVSFFFYYKLFISDSSSSSFYIRPLTCVIPLSYACGVHADYLIATSIWDLQF